MRKLFEIAKRSWEWRREALRAVPEGDEGLKVLTHRRMVGGLWDEIGELQFRFLVGQAELKPSDVFCDVACGSFRAGRFLIPYLDPGHYLGIEKQEALVREGRLHEIPAAVWDARRPEIVISETFDFGRFSKKPTKAIAQSLFTHIDRRDIRRCLRRLFEHAAPGCEFYATFQPAHEPIVYTLSSHANRAFRHSRESLLELGRNCGWTSSFIGDWGHPRGQQMLKFVKPA